MTQEEKGRSRRIAQSPIETSLRSTSDFKTYYHAALSAIPSRSHEVILKAAKKGPINLTAELDVDEEDYS